MVEQRKAVEEELEEVKEALKQLQLSVDLLQSEVYHLRYEKPRTVWTPALIGQIGGFILGAIVLIGIFWR
ncbi:MAG: hypothetical protein ACE3JP_15225 [Ectobacillus sp.]